jgi:glucose-6-phosphate isomerase
MENNWQNLDTRAAFKKLQALKGVTINAAALTAERVRACSVPIAAGLTYNYGAKEQDERVLSVLQELADEADLIGKFAELANGAIVNTGEKRKVLHHATRGQLGSETGSFYAKQQAAIAAFCAKVHGGSLVNEQGATYTDVVQIGIGGSDLGPRAMYLALEQWAKKQGKLKLRAHFISNVDPDDGAGVLADLDLSRSLCILVSKSGTTQETLANELFVKARLQKAGLDPARHVLAVTSETSPLANNPAYLASFYMDDNIGGRYSSTSAVGGAVLSLAFGPDVFASFLKGAHAADEAAFKERNILKNAALLDALLGIYERNVQGHPATAVLPYSQALSRFPAHLQQLDMESNG